MSRRKQTRKRGRKQKKNLKKEKPHTRKLTVEIRKMMIMSTEKFHFQKKRRVPKKMKNLRTHQQKETLQKEGTLLTEKNYQKKTKDVEVNINTNQGSANQTTSTTITEKTKYKRK